MRILNVNVTLDSVHGGGMMERTVQMSRALAAAGHQCTILTLDLGLTPERVAMFPGIKIVALRCLSRRFYLPAFSLAKIRQTVASVDIVHLMGTWTLLNILVYYYVRKQAKPYVICPAGALPIFGRSKWIKRAYSWLIGRRIVLNANRCIAITPDESEFSHRYGVQTGRAVVIPNGIDLSAYVARDPSAFRLAHGIPDGPFLLFVGRLNLIKGPDLLLAAFCAVRDEFPHHLVFAGPDGGMGAAMKKTVAEYGIENRVHFIGYISGAEKSAAYHATDALIIPSRSEAMSIVVLEAGAAGTPVLLTDQCGFGEIEAIGGGLVVPATVEGLARGLVSLLSQGDRLPQMGTRLKAYTEQHFPWEKIAQTYVQLYEQILREVAVPALGKAASSDAPA
jgi:glycosyltransferase involved in cell wall biosynthesis